MTGSVRAGQPMRRRGRGFPWIGLLFAAQIAVLSLVYLRFADMDCAATLSDGMCRAGGYAVHRLLAVLALFALFRLARPAAFDLLDPSAARVPKALAVNGIGFLLLLLPGLVALLGSAPPMILTIVIWCIGAVLAIGGALAAFAPLGAWRRFGRASAPTLIPLLAIALFAPEIKNALSPLYRHLWQSQSLITDVTFNLVYRLLELFGYEITVEIDRKVIGAGDFFVQIYSSCSGVQGFALTTGFLVIYMVLMWRDLAFPAALLLFPIGIFLSWVLNVVRITALVAIGLEGAPGLAVGGFHSYAGSLAFAVLAIGLIVVANRTPFFLRGERAAPAPSLPPLFRDPVAAQILPFVVFMLSGIVASTFFSIPGLAYPLRFFAMVAILLAFLPMYRGMGWRLDPLAAATGVAIAVAWIATAPPADSTGPLAAAIAGLGPVAFFGWVLCRALGTTLAVPLIEELFFRGYLVQHLGRAGDTSKGATGGVVRLTIAVVISTASFAILHDKWFLAGVAGLIFAALTLRPNGRVVDAVVSHMTANAIIAVYAILAGNWAAI